MATAAARTVFRSASIRSAAARIGAGAKPSRSSFSAPSPKSPLSNRFFRCPAELGACAGSLQPFHTATASSLMTSMLSLSCRDYGWLAEVGTGLVHLYCHISE